MFERYTEKARRAIFFARYETSQLGLREITTDCLLVGILRERQDIQRWLGMDVEQLREIVAENTAAVHDRPEISVEMPLTNEAKRVLAYAAEEAERLNHRHIGTEHLFLGLLREPETLASRRIKEREFTLDQIRVELAQDSAHNTFIVKARPDVPRGQQVTLYSEDKTEIATVTWTGRIPAIGEQISVAAASDDEAAYRVVDISWRVRKVEAEAIRDTQPILDIASIGITVREEPA